jgi:hypothetical protein
VTGKKRLEQVIRGWLPKEPNLHNAKQSMGRNRLASKRVLILISVSVTCFVLVVGGVLVFLSWYSEQVLENFKGYSARLEDDGFTVESKLLSESQVDVKYEWYWFGDFRSYAAQENITTVYYDQDIKGLYYLTPISPTNNGVQANIFYYNKLL